MLTSLNWSGFASRLDAILAPSGRNAKFWQQPLCQDYIGDKKRHSPNPIRHVHFFLSADSQFTQERHHRAPVGKSRLKQIQPNKSREKVPVRAYVVPECKGQQNKAARDQTKCSFYGHNSSPSELQAVLHNLALRRFAFRDIFRCMRMHRWKRVSPLREVIKNRHCHSR